MLNCGVLNSSAQFFSLLLNQEKQNNTVQLCLYLKVNWCKTFYPHLSHSPSTDRDPDLLPADVAAEVAIPGSEEQDLHRGSAAVLHGHGPAGPQHHILPYEPGHAVQEGTMFFIVLLSSPAKIE